MQHVRDKRQKGRTVTVRQLADFLITLGKSHGSKPWDNRTSARQLLTDKFGVPDDIAGRAVTLAIKRAGAH